MEILAWLVAAMVVNVACMAQIMRWQADRLRGWKIRTGEALRVHGLASLEGGMCALAALYGMAYLPGLGSQMELALSILAFFVPYYFQLRYSAYRLAKSQRERGRGVARQNVRDIANATFGYASALYLAFGAAGEVIWKMSNG
jgi:hypothetical protein